MDVLYCKYVGGACGIWARATTKARMSDGLRREAWVISMYGLCLDETHLWTYIHTSINDEQM